ncbi:MAG: hypothetical protein Q7J67_00485 [bacterium]|nr:hypothetical protein [bacterium]
MEKEFVGEVILINLSGAKVFPYLTFCAGIVCFLYFSREDRP